MFPIHLLLILCSATFLPKTLSSLNTSFIPLKLPATRLNIICSENLYKSLRTATDILLVKLWNKFVLFQKKTQFISSCCLFFGILTWVEIINIFILLNWKLILGETFWYFKNSKYLLVLFHRFIIHRTPFSLSNHQWQFGFFLKGTIITLFSELIHFNQSINIFKFCF